MQVKNKIIISTKYPVIVLLSQCYRYLLEHGVLSFPRSGASLRVIIKKNISLLFGRYYEASTGKINTSNVFLASDTNKAQPQKLINSPNAGEKHEYFGDRFNFFHDLLNSFRNKAELLKIKRKINKLQRIIDAPKVFRPGYGSQEYDVNSYFIEIDNKGVMRLIEIDKDRVREVRRTKDLEELLFWIFTNITFAMACKDKTGKNANGYDHRKQVFLIQEELLGKLNPRWKEKIHAEHKEFLKKYPVDNIKGEGTVYCEALRKMVRSETVENAPNYFKFP